MNNVKLIFFKGCPNTENVRQALKNISVDFDELDQNMLKDTDNYKNYASPTVLIDDQVILGGKAGGGGCSLGIPSGEELNKIFMKINRVI